MGWGINISIDYEKELILWLKEKKLVFAHDGRQTISFDLVNLAQSPNLKAAQERVHKMEEFC